MESGKIIDVLEICKSGMLCVWMDDTAKGGLTQFLGTFCRDSLRAQRFQTLISLFEDYWVWN